MSESTLPITIRQGAESDFGFILTGFTRELHKTIPYNFIPNASFFPHYTDRLKDIISKSTVLVANIEESPDDIVGYIIFQPLGQDFIVHWAYVKGIFRRMGVVKELLEHMGAGGKTLVCTHYFMLFPKLRDKHHLVFDHTLLGAEL